MIPTTHDREARTANPSPSNVNGDSSHEYTPTVPTQPRDARAKGRFVEAAMTPAEQYLENFTRAILVDALLEAWPQYWERRARAFENARPVVGEHHGDRGRDELRAKWLELTEIAAACRARGTLAPVELFEADVDLVLEEFDGGDVWAEAS